MADWQEELMRALKSGDEEQMEAVLRRVPTSVLQSVAPTLAKMADQCARDGQFDEALTYLDRLIELNPDERRWRRQRAVINLAREKPEAAIADAERVVAIRQDDVDAYRLLAEAHDRLSNWREALTAYRRLCELAPGDPKASERIEWIEAELRKGEMLQRLLDPQAATAAPHATPPLPRIEFDPGC